MIGLRQRSARLWLVGLSLLSFGAAYSAPLVAAFQLPAVSSAAEVSPLARGRSTCNQVPDARRPRRYSFASKRAAGSFRCSRHPDVGVVRALGCRPVAPRARGDRDAGAARERQLQPPAGGEFVVSTGRASRSLRGGTGCRRGHRHSAGAAGGAGRRSSGRRGTGAGGGREPRPRPPRGAARPQSRSEPLPGRRSSGRAVF